MPAMFPPTTQRAVNHLLGLGFTVSANGHDITHPRAEVRVIDPDCACFTIRPRRYGEPRYLFWEVQLTRAPLDVFAATVAAAIRND